LPEGHQFKSGPRNQIKHQFSPPIPSAGFFRFGAGVLWLVNLKKRDTDFSTISAFDHAAAVDTLSSRTHWVETTLSAV
jgi:hypothetical protein